MAKSRFSAASVLTVTQHWRANPPGKGAIKVRLIKMFGLAAVAAVAAMAFVGASSAMAENTALCANNEAICAAPLTHIHLESVGSTELLVSGLPTILCLKSLVLLHVEGEALAKPLALKTETLTWEGCGNNAEHNNCKVVNLALPLFDVLKSVLNLAEAKALGAEVLVECSGIHCVYGGPEVKGFSVEGALHTAGAGHGMFTASKLEVPKVKGFLCPEKSLWDALYEPLVHTYISL